MNETELVKQAQSGDFEAFSQLIGAHKTKIYNLSLKMTGNVHDAEDVVQETLLKAIDKIDQFRGEAAFGTWLFSIALNQSRAHLAKQKQTDLKPLEEYLPSGKAKSAQDHETFRLFDWQDPHKKLENDELKLILDKAMQSLPVKYREAFILRYLDELSIKEIALLINETEAATKSRVLRARLALREFLSNTFEDSYGKKVS